MSHFLGRKVSNLTDSEDNKKKIISSITKYLLSDDDQQTERETIIQYIELSNAKHFILVVEPTKGKMKLKGVYSE